MCWTKDFLLANNNELKYNLKDMWKRGVIILLVTLKLQVSWGQKAVIINEIMYDAPQFVKDTNGEWVELYNPNEVDIDISNWRFNDGVKDKIIPAGTTIKSDEYLVLAEDNDTFKNYGYQDLFTLVIIGNFSLDDGSDTLTLKDSSLNPIDILNYNKNWGVGTSNSGRTLEKIYPAGSNTDFYWDSSKTSYGTPGRQNSVYLDVGAIQRIKLLINEIMFSGSYDWVETYCLDDGNKGKGTQIKGFYFNDLDGDEDKVIGTCSMRTGDFLLLHYGIKGSDETFGVNGKINLFTDKESITSTTDQIVLYNPLNEIVDAVCWADDTPPSNEEEDRNILINAGKWDGPGIDTTKVSKGQSIARYSILDTNTKNDWSVSSIPTPGLANELISEVSISPKIKVVKIINKISCPQEGKNPIIIYSLSKSAQVSVRIYDLRGRLVKRLIEREYKIAQDENTISWDGKDEKGNFLPVGVYIGYLEAVSEDGASSDKISLILAKKL